jgi:hypothetical protein
VVNGTEVLRQAATGNDLLGNTPSISMSSMLAAAGVTDATTIDHLTLELRRDSPGCGGLYGTGQTKLFTLLVQPDLPPTLTMSARTQAGPALPIAGLGPIFAGAPLWQVMVVSGDTVSLDAKVTRGPTTPISGATVSFYLQSPTAGQQLSAASAVTDASGTATVTLTTPTSSTGVSAQPVAAIPIGAGPCAAGQTQSSATCMVQNLFIEWYPHPVYVYESASTSATGNLLQRNVDTATFFATDIHTGSHAVSWSATGGTIDSNGVYTAGGVPGHYSITASAPDGTTTYPDIYIPYELSDFVGTYVGTHSLTSGAEPTGSQCPGGSDATLTFSNPQPANPPDPVFPGGLTLTFSEGQSNCSAEGCSYCTYWSTTVAVRGEVAPGQFVMRAGGSSSGSCSQYGIITIYAPDSPAGLQGTVTYAVPDGCPPAATDRSYDFTVAR